MTSNSNPMTILDTNMVSEMMRRNPEPAVVAWLDGQVKANLFVTAVTEAELRYGVVNMDAGRRRNELAREVDNILAFDFAGRILPFDSEAAREYAAIRAHLDSIGHPVEDLDLMIAAIARSYGAAVATRNVRDFADCGVPLINPWEMGGSV